MKTRQFAGAAALAAACLAFATPVAAQDIPESITISGSATLVTDYRFRGVSMTDKEMAVQAGLDISHESGVYIGTWASNLSGWGTFGGSNMELDIYGGYATEVVSGITVDVGLTWYMFPGGLDTTDFAEPYVKVSGDIGPANLLVGVAYAPKQEALGTWYNTAASVAYDNPGDKNDNLYIWTDGSVGVPNTGLTLKGHIGFSDGNPGLGPWGTSPAPTGKYIDWMLGADYVLGPVTLGVAYVDTDLSKSETAYLQPNFSSTKDGSSIAGSTVLFSISAGF
ncbi:TorF family putative porin [Novosphingobium mangrovi (ex Huang et al. 2023)]|uniref:TorF family putative porin n=1 Tax=Novosphingobium mangrovi (ex Huang et al. 2023) TaxID=2976432 RepID=A0ABT2I9I4_9SPHN|nr:TorF family putative porin [Novosphingobium mangrovi (ex Huang et al. 2023)]MCT2401482.1 TorF family putative porin [Novosphingobium mangrovi (ex Huang et al. 2023)]